MMIKSTGWKSISVKQVRCERLSPVGYCFDDSEYWKLVIPVSAEWTIPVAGFMRIEHQGGRRLVWSKIFFMYIVHTLASEYKINGFKKNRVKMHQKSLQNRVKKKIQKMFILAFEVIAQLFVYILFIATFFSFSAYCFAIYQIPSCQSFAL